MLIPGTVLDMARRRTVHHWLHTGRNCELSGGGIEDSSMQLATSHILQENTPRHGQPTLLDQLREASTTRPLACKDL
jgi:hypothetical protein